MFKSFLTLLQYADVTLLAFSNSELTPIRTAPWVHLTVRCAQLHISAPLTRPNFWRACRSIAMDWRMWSRNLHKTWTIFQLIVFLFCTKSWLTFSFLLLQEMSIMKLWRRIQNSALLENVQSILDFAIIEVFVVETRNCNWKLAFDTLNRNERPTDFNGTQFFRKLDKEALL